MANPIHPTATRKRQYRYIFMDKHHGGGKADDACWAPDLTRSDEFSVFDQADHLDIVDVAGRFYGVLRTAEGVLLVLGTWHQQIAEFPRANDGVPWHGYPIWPVNDDAPGNRSHQLMRPGRSIFSRMEQVGLITVRQRKRLFKGDYA